jgi:PAS domain S-box-containing protein
MFEADMIDLEKKIILVVEDEKITAMDIRERLKGLGFEAPMDVSTGEEAIKLVAELKPDLVLMDIVLRGKLDGIQTADIIKDRYRIPVVFLTAFSDDRTLQRAKVTEPFGYILKPFEERELHTTIEMALYKHSMDRRIRLSQESFAKVFEMHPDALNINRISDGTCVDVNKGFVSMTGYTKEEVIGKTGRELNLWEDLSVRDWGLAQLREHGELLNLDARFRMKSGRIIDGLISAVPMEFGGERCVVSITRDVTEQKKAEAELQSSEKRYREFFERDLTGNFVARPDGAIVDCNPAFLKIFKFGSTEDSARSNIAQLFPSSEHWKQVVAILEKRDLENHEQELMTSDGKPLYVIENLFGEFDEQGNLAQIRGFIFDNTERKILEQQLFHSQRMESIGTLASGIAHDFNNVLANILGFAHQMRKNVTDQAKVTRYADIIEKSASRGADLANQLMLFVRKKKHERATTNIEDIVDEVIQLTAETFPKFIEVQKDFTATLKHVSGDKGELYQALLNLCLNARDAMLEKGKESGNSALTIGAISRLEEADETGALQADEKHRKTDCIEIFVRDNGVGIPANIIDKVFDPFFTTKERGKGTGLGLSVVYNIVRNHNGVITVESEEGKGTTFRIVLPAVETESNESESAGHEKLRASNNELILLVDDEVMMQELGRELLEDAGYRAVIAQNGNQAVDIYRKRAKEISLVILDLVMPGMDGGQTYVQLKKINPGIKAFFCTGYAEDSAISELIESEQLHALQKPFRPPLFLRAVREALGDGAK